MHTLRRSIIVLLLGAVTLAAGGSLALLSDARGAVQQEFLSLLDQARDSYRARSGVSSTESRGKVSAAAAQKQLAVLGREKRDLRLRIASTLAQLQGYRNRAAFLEVEQRRLDRVAVALRDDASFAAARVSIHDEEGTAYVFRRLFSVAIGADMDLTLYDSGASERREAALRVVAEERDANLSLLSHVQETVGAYATQLADLRTRHESILTAYRKADETLERAQRTVEVSEEQLAAIKREVARVHADVLRLQGQLARIDAQIKSRAERALIQNGLLEPRPGEERAQAAASFIGWPALGRITATFGDQAYQRHFGIPHLAIDIARPQGSAVVAAADGVVFVVRDGGETGYSYILIGHRDGYATLYGHLSSLLVEPGQDVQRGETIGLSGGQPGTPGAGPMTTGQHLHFEVIRQGTNIDPLTVLPHR
jgi:murein DD-endopeptidase MepM/ murein hydrolase activator NlpD